MFDVIDPAGFVLLSIAAGLVGLAKGGLSGVGVLGLPLMSLVVSPVQAAGIMLPILLMSDAVSLWQWWGQWNRRVLSMMVPGAAVGIALGWLLAAQVSDAMVRVVVGLIAIGFVLRWLQGRWRGRQKPAAENAKKAGFWGFVTGFTSMVAHAGGPPFSIYALPLGLSPVVLTSTSVGFFAMINVIKIGPYFLLGQFSATNMLLAAALMPVTIVATLLGAFAIRRISAGVFYPLANSLLLLVGLKLLYDGITGWGA